ncbi:MAG: hypothetical protein PHH49_07050 [Candidatus Omnitrophica bacterium]|nr:hypothetical protein [Candidatus Omnitrophota bacterium]MDD5488695.1 hypothetical protein [Candidatus Omnitrophota bacterium]
MLTVVLCALSSGRVSFALDEDVKDRYASADTAQVPEALAASKAPSFGDMTEISGFIDVQQGYDSNVDLDSKKHEDAFLQTTANLDIKYKQFDGVRLMAGVDTFESIYYNRNSNNIIDIAPYIGFDLDVITDVVLKSRVIYDQFLYPGEKENSYSGIVLSNYLRHYPVNWGYHELGFEYVKRWYPDNKVVLDDLTVSDNDRTDDRYRVRYNLAARGDRVYARLSNEYSRNDSNYTYREYYDFWQYRIKPSLMFFMTERFYLDASLVYKYTRYKDRRITTDSGTRESDRTYIASLSVYYDLTKNATLSLTYSYSDNKSNDPFQKYSGSVISGGLFYSF